MSPRGLECVLEGWNTSVHCWNAFYRFGIPLHRAGIPLYRVEMLSRGFGCFLKVWNAF
jgi:hypothetical protein